MRLTLAAPRAAAAYANHERPNQWQIPIGVDIECGCAARIHQLQIRRRAGIKLQLDELLADRADD